MERERERDDDDDDDERERKTTKSAGRREYFVNAGGESGFRKIKMLFERNGRRL